MYAVDRDMKMMGMERKMADDRIENDGEEPSMTVAVTPDDETSRRKEQ